MTARLGDLVAVEAQKGVRQPAPRILAGIFLAYVLLVAVSLSLVLRGSPSQGVDAGALLTPLRQGALHFIGGIYASIATLLAVVFACDAMGQEFSRGTFRTLVLAGARRGQVPLAKLLLLTVIAVGAALLVAVGTLLTVWALSAASGEELLQLSLDGIGRLLLLAFVPVLAWGVLALLGTLALHSLGAGLASSLSLLVAGDLLGSLFARLGTIGVWTQRALPNTAINALSEGPSADDWPWVAANLALYLGGGAWWAFARLRRLDLLAATR